MTTFLLIGLGNPGKSYESNRHNIGFMAVDRIAEDYRFSKPAKKFGGSICEGIIGESRVFVFKPLGYMNTSGGPASEAARFYKIPLENIIAIHDELDLPLGRLRVKRGGGNGGHNGLKSLEDHLGNEYWRVRVGIGHPGDKDLVTDYVLNDFSKAEKPMVGLMLDEISKHMGLLLDGDEAKFMSKIALETQEEK
jgi:PTH1 family peptidyl-tRNA hydrolase